MLIGGFWKDVRTVTTLFKFLNEFLSSGIVYSTVFHSVKKNSSPKSHRV